MADSEWSPPTFTVGQHESERKIRITNEISQLAHDGGYDMLTTPVTTPHFQSRVLSLLSSHLSSSRQPVQDPTGTFFTSRNTSPLKIPSFTTADTNLRPDGANSHVVAVSSRWIDLCSPDPLIADISRQVLLLELAYAAFCGAHYALIHGPRLHHGNLHGDGLIYYARAIQEVLNTAPYIRVNIWLPVVDSPELETNEMGDLSPFARREYLDNSQPEVSPKLDIFGTWDAWNIIRKVCKYHTRLVVALSLPRQLPPSTVQSRWLSEPVRIITLASASFVKNQKSFPVLSKAHQSYIFRAMRGVPPWIFLCDVGPIPGIEKMGNHAPTPAEAARSPKKKEDIVPHLSYIRNLEQKQPHWTRVENFTLGYQDYLQAPLQPLTVNLESVTYEVFETDPVKYEWYERAIAKALKDWALEKKPTSNPDGRVVLAVVGAGRGPLVSRAIRASVEAGVDIKLWALEKNQNAFVHLQRQNEAVWGESVTLVHSDMRSWKGPGREIPAQDVAAENGKPSMVHYPVDIIVSELLGSFGDNELSPECLDGVDHLLNPVHGISIPTSYSSHITPISAPRLYADIQNQTISNPAAPETPYVVMLQAFDYLSTAPSIRSSSGSASTSTATLTSSSTPSTTPPPIKEVDTPIIKTAWSFSHPNPNLPEESMSSSRPSNSHNTRQTRLTFPCSVGGTCHGLGGYFETVLYGDVELSTNPLTMDAKSKDMISWFPIYFPLKSPIYVSENSDIVLTMFRQTDDRKVWYEWMVEVFMYRNATDMRGGGQSKRIRVAMSDIHSSIRDGCLM
ncbi:arginine N-methyltransferase HSL7 [Arthroderma uncinatum]|uniref:arginine N-methyltransferase HSL7 n=1 Tax=Arthroderma uncinatum TaxID=74035 RepID=UPI00144ACB94|nr:arginine N-methyltransferase HSL7 [Arthroderma uncinatum]KAF3483168.1 arginine N-methyltransferase HSL7 [Arthroderma uncinatum]